MVVTGGEGSTASFPLTSGTLLPMVLLGFPEALPLLMDIPSIAYRCLDVRGSRHQKLTDLQRTWSRNAVMEMWRLLYR